jgi:hypothetical protein
MLGYSGRKEKLVCSRADVPRMLGQSVQLPATCKHCAYKPLRRQNQLEEHISV